ncbi:hypothetical protein CspeluHIS016_0602060 [Cutaneotrichosporon spelunceum]|uniref:ABC transporter domain-containing protein n=1 Tax=Cutaneotrichosporon spelunceum TaxID=1672016 RepID=A0AAD3YE92_9TREE|nr:hypothetical protein CspeluHIS016_0602060 [Cutaneotrichosporon spelunceum]
MNPPAERNSEDKPPPYLRVRIASFERNRKDLLVRFDASTNLPNFRTSLYRNLQRSYVEFQRFGEQLQLCCPQNDRLVRIALQRWFSRVADDPQLQQEDELRSFIESDFGYNPIPPLSARKQTSGGGATSVLTAALSKVVRRGPLDEDDEIMSARTTLERLEPAWAAAANSIGNLSKARKALASAQAEVGAKLIGLATDESDMNLATAERKMGRAYEQMAGMAMQQITSDNVILNDSLAYQSSNAKAGRDALAQRTQILEDSHNATKTAITKRRNVERMKGSSNINPQKVDDAISEMEEANAIEDRLTSNLNAISAHLHTALRTHSRNAHEDVAFSLLEHARMNIIFNRSVLRELEALKPDLHATPTQPTFAPTPRPPGLSQSMYVPAPVEPGPRSHSAGVRSSTPSTPGNADPLGGATMAQSMYAAPGHRAPQRRQGRALDERKAAKLLAGPSTLQQHRQSTHGAPPPGGGYDPPPLTPAVATGLGLLTSFTLPPKYDHLPVVTRLWLQSRVVSPSSASSKNETTLERAGWARSISWRNFKIGVDIMRFLGPRTARLILNYRDVLALPLLMYLVEVVGDGILPAAVEWASGQMLDLVEKAFAGSPSTWGNAMRIAAIAIGLEVYSYMCTDVFRSCHEFMNSFSEYHLERLFLRAKLNEAMRLQEDKTFTAIVDEAAVFVGFETMSGIACPPYGPWSMMSSAGQLVSASIELGLQIVLVFSTVRTAMRGSNFSFGNSILIGLSLAPMCFDILFEKLSEWFPQSYPQLDPQDLAAENELSTLREFAQGKHREELILFNLKPYILERMEKLRRAPRRTLWSYNSYFWVQVMRLGFSELITNSFYVLLAVRAIPSTLTLGAIHVHRTSAERMHSTIRSFKWRLETTWQLPYFLAALFLSQEGPVRRGPQLNYERHRRPGGMRLEARNLGLTYDGTAPTLRNINITVEPGESLAVVGFNGSGKTTLVRALLGLHSHSGTLLINDIPFEDFDAVTLHSRMSCLFQDYDRYDLSVRQNVGFGNTDKMENDVALNGALERGGATTLVQGIGGLDRLLSSQSFKRPPVNNGAATPTGSSETDSNVISTTAPKTADDDTCQKQDGSDLASQAREPAKLSGGQWQRIALSRAFLRHGQTDLIVLDEPSASLDARSEKELFDTVHSLTKGGENGRTTCIFISHRFATVKKASRIAFVESGTIVEYGTHAELMELGGRYAEMYNIQKSAFDD